MNLLLRFALNVLPDHSTLPLPLNGALSCIKCEPGTFQTTGGQTFCQWCEVGKFQNQSGNSFCMQCEKGTYNNQTNQSICLECEQGTYENEIGKETCKQCPKNTTSKPKSLSISDCQCKTGYTINELAQCDQPPVIPALQTAIVILEVKPSGRAGATRATRGRTAGS
eukprot:204737-Hanusia_phi.AAC.1